MKRRGLGGLVFLAVVVAAAVIWLGTAGRPKKANPRPETVSPQIQTPVTPTPSPDVPEEGPSPLGAVQKLQDRQVFASQSWNPEIMSTSDHEDVDSFASRTVTSPKGRLKAFLSPVEFETIADVYVEDTTTASAWQLRLSLDKTLTPTRLAWLDEKQLLVIVAYAYGTTSLGGDVYLVNAFTGRGALWYKPAGHCQVTEVAVIGNKVQLTVARFDANYDEHTTQKVVLDRP